MGITATTAKHVLLLLNFIFAVLGVVLVGFGIYFLISVAENAVSVGENVAGGLIIGLGVIIFIITIFGCLAAIHEARVRLLIYIIAVVLLILTQLLFLSMASHGTKDGIAGSINEGFDRLWDEERKESGALAYYEESLHCCGVNSSEDYWIIKHAIPSTCCIDRKCVDTTSVFNVGCKAQFEEYLASKLLTFKIVCWILVVGEAIGVFFGWILFSSLKNESRRNNAIWM